MGSTQQSCSERPRSAHQSISCFTFVPASGSLSTAMQPTAWANLEVWPSEALSCLLWKHPPHLLPMPFTARLHDSNFWPEPLRPSQHSDPDSVHQPASAGRRRGNPYPCFCMRRKEVTKFVLDTHSADKWRGSAWTCVSLINI